MKHDTLFKLKASKILEGSLYLRQHNNNINTSFNLQTGNTSLRTIKNNVTITIKYTTNIPTNIIIINSTMDRIRMNIIHGKESNNNTTYAQNNGEPYNKSHIADNITQQIAHPDLKNSNLIEELKVLNIKSIYYLTIFN